MMKQITRVLLVLLYLSIIGVVFYATWPFLVIAVGFLAVLIGIPALHEWAFDS